MLVCLGVLSPETNVGNLGAVLTKVSGEVESEMCNGGEGHHSETAGW